MSDFRAGWAILAIAICYFGIDVSLAFGQFGLTALEIENRYRARTEKYYDRDAADDEFRTMTARLIGAGVPGRPSLDVSLHEGKCVCIRGAGHGLDFGRPELTPQAVQWLLANCNSHVRNGTPRAVKWNLSGDYLSVFPPVGRSSSSALPLLRSSGIQVKSQFVDRRTGRVVSETPWSDLAPGPPIGALLLSSANVVDKFVLESDDGSLYAIVVAKTRANAGGLTTGVRVKEEVPEFLICDADYFWQYTEACVTGKFNFDEYEPGLGAVIPAHAKESLALRRLAQSFACIADSPSFDIARLKSESDRLSKKHAAFPASAQEQLLNGIYKRSPAIQLRRIGVLGEMASPEAILKLLPLLRKPRELPVVARKAVRQIADRHMLPPPPMDDARYSEWEQWGEMAVPQKK